jgi:hypothetical protein
VGALLVHRMDGWIGGWVGVVVVLALGLGGVRDHDEISRAVVVV